MYEYDVRIYVICATRAFSQSTWISSWWVMAPESEWLGGIQTFQQQYNISHFHKEGKSNSLAKTFHLLEPTTHRRTPVITTAWTTAANGIDQVLFIPKWSFQTSVIHEQFRHSKTPIKCDKMSKTRSKGSRMKNGWYRERRLKILLYPRKLCHINFLGRP